MYSIQTPLKHARVLQLSRGDVVYTWPPIARLHCIDLEVQRVPVRIETGCDSNEHPTPFLGYNHAE